MPKKVTTQADRDKATLLRRLRAGGYWVEHDGHCHWTIRQSKRGHRSLASFRADYGYVYAESDFAAEARELLEGLHIGLVV